MQDVFFVRLYFRDPPTSEYGLCDTILRKENMTKNAVTNKMMT